MTKQEANKTVTRMSKAQWFCPLIKDSCNTDCVCYDPPKIVLISTAQQTYTIGGNACTANVLIGC